MKKKKPTQKEQNSGPFMEPAFPMPDPRSMERLTADLSQLLSEQKFESAEAVNAYMQKLMGRGGTIPRPPKRTPLQEAQNLMYDAWEASGEERIELAQRALEVSKDCADAYVLLAEETAEDLDEAAVLYALGVKAGERALGQRMFKENAGHFWGITQTRPYMRARAGLADCLWRQEKHEQAIEHYFEMLRLNPNDNQGIRYLLVIRLLEMGADDRAGKLLAQYDDGTAAWLYSRALWSFRKQGANQQANTRLREARQSNRYVPTYLLGKRSLPAELPESYTLGSKEEAIGYAAEALPAWQKTGGALEWLKTALLQ
jgi:tetratricopeptide (TPR) repeat protein